MKASWGKSHQIADSPEDLDRIIASIRSTKQPTMLFLEGTDGRVLIAGIGHHESVLTYSEPDGTSFHSVGDLTRSEHLVFLCRDQLDEFMAEMAVSEEVAITAAHEFLRTTQRPSAVSWEPDW